MKHNVRLLKLAGVLAVLFGAGIVLGVGYRWLQESIFPAPLFVTAANNSAPADAVTPPNPVPPAIAPSANSPSGNSSSEMISNAPVVQPPKPAPQGAGNVVVLNPVQPPAAPPAPSGNELRLPQVQSPQTTDRLPVIGGDGQTIWMPRAIEGCWQGSGGSHLQYLGGCPNMVSGTTSPIKLRWCFRRIGNQPLTLTMAKGQYPGRVRQRWEVMSAHGQTMALRETISYQTMMFLHVVDVGDWTCRITPAGQLECQEHEMAHCGPAKWMQPPWFRGSGWVTARRVDAGNLGRRAASGP
ncbi:MAG TPA: hypothetical protein VNF29_12200 [Candidatus Binataceae bacterium]|nr:hypothetical protein [Candidatus Binataceae bacterium]